MFALILTTVAFLWTPASTPGDDSQPDGPPAVAEPSTTVECVPGDTSGFDEEGVRAYVQMTYPPPHFEGVDDGMTYEQRIDAMIDIARAQCASPDSLLYFMINNNEQDELYNIITVGCPEAVAIAYGG
jgi:hypothetical protein